MATSGTVVRYAAYLEKKHQYYLETIWDYARARFEQSPFGDFVSIDINEIYLGVGEVITSFPAVFDLYGDYITGIDPDELFDEIVNKTTGSPTIENYVTAHGALLSDDLEQTVLPRFELGMRDINAVMTSSFIIGKSLLELHRTRELEKFDAELRYKMLMIAADKWKINLEWNKFVFSSYADLMKLYLASKVEMEDRNYEYLTKDLLWPFTISEYMRAAVGSLTGASNTYTKVAGESSKGSSAVSGVVGGAISGAASGAMVGSVVPGLGTGWGAVIGGVLGAASGLLSSE